jgi:CheY-like chemotaxis protein
MPNRPLILIIDDEADFREIFGTKLTSAGFWVETAENGETGIRKAKELKADLILMDVKMPGVSGADAVLRLKDDPQTKDIKVVFLTALGDPRQEMQEVSRRLSAEFGAAGYIKKTEDLDTVVEQVRGFLR